MELIIDNFAGGGGASTGLAWALGREVDVAVNHDEAAIAVHAANHPSTKHYCQSIFSIDPMDATQGRPVALIWFSPDCKHHSKAKGGKPRDKNIRDMAWVVPHWIERLKKATAGGKGMPRVIMLENVEEFRQWGPLDENGKPIPERRGEEFDLWVRRIRRLGYRVEWKELRACDFGAPTSRKRLFLIARSDGQPIVWPQPTHGRPTDPLVHAGKLLPYRTAAECIDWSIDCPSIFERKTDLKPSTCRRIAAGVMRHVVNAARPFIVPITHTKNGPVSHSIDEPLRTITTARGGEMALSTANLVVMRNNCDHLSVEQPVPTVAASGLHIGLSAATLVQVGYSERAGQAPRVPHLDKPIGTLVGTGKHAVVGASLVGYYGDNDGRAPRSYDLSDPIRTQTTENRFGLVSAFMAQHNGGPRNDKISGHSAEQPLSTLTGRGTQQQVVQVTMIEENDLESEQLNRAVQVAAFLVKYYGAEVGQHQAIDVPIDTVTAKARFAVVTVTIDAQKYILVDIGMRMLSARELANAQGFPSDYILDPVCWYLTETGRRKYGPLPKTHQIAKIGNSVCPVMSEALARVNLPELCGQLQEMVA
jgi:DNA (cytosine-5)-methyltransferase 1